MVFYFLPGFKQVYSLCNVILFQIFSYKSLLIKLLFPKHFNKYISKSSKSGLHVEIQFVCFDWVNIDSFV